MLMRLRQCMILGLFFLLTGWGAICHGQELALGDRSSYMLGGALTYLEDPQGTLTFDDILQPQQQSRFQPLRHSDRGANFGLTASAVWLRVRVRTLPQADPNWLLELAYPPLDELQLYSPQAPGVYQRQLAGDLRPFASRPVAHRNHVLPLTLPAGATSTVYLRIASQGTLSAPLQLWRPAALWQHDQAEYAALSLYFGLLIGLLAYNLLLFISVRDPAYLIYGLFVACMATAQAALTGLGYQFVWPEQTWWNGVSTRVGLSLTAVFGMAFARIFLRSRKTMPLMDKGILGSAAAWMLTLAAALTLPAVWSVWMITVLAPISVVVLVASGVIALRRGHAGARSFVAAWAVLLLGVFTLFLHDVGALPSNAFTSNSMLIGSAMEMVLLSFALGDRINAARRFREQAQARIAAERAMVEALSESQERLRTLLAERETILDTSIVGIAFLTPQGRFRWANKAMLDIFGAQKHEVESMEPFYSSREQYRQIGGEVAAAVARSEVYESELQMRRVDGTLIWVSLSGRAVSRRDLGQGTVWVIMNITRRKELEEQLQKTNSEREAILNNAVVGIVLSVKRRHEWVNEKFAQMLGYPRQILIGQPSSYIHPDEASWLRFGDEARAALIATGSYVCEMQLKRRNGELFWVQMGGSCVRPSDPDSGVIWTFLDITHRKRSEAEMREALEQQKALNELRSRFVAMTSHEFRTPLAAILSAEELLRHYGDRLPASDRMEILDSIAGGVQRMSRMLDRVLLLGRADAQMLEFKPHWLDLPALCGQLVEEARAQHPESSCQVKCECGPAVTAGRYDEKLLRHIFGNLLSNALKYSPAGGVVRFEVSRRKGEIAFEVADQGIGIPSEEIPHLFESFHRASNVGSIQGTGLGLAIVKNAVEKHGGRIEVHSRLGEGTTFTVTLPAGDPDRPS